MIALSIVTTSHALAQRIFRTTSAKLGGGALGSWLRQQVTHWTDAAVFTQPDQWKGFISAMVTALLYLRNFLEEIIERPQTRHFREQREARPSDSGQTSSHRGSNGSTKTLNLLRSAAQMQEWDKDKFTAGAEQEYRLGAEKIAEIDKHICLAMKRLTAGIAREIGDTSKTAGEAWYRLTDWFYGRNVQGATAIASQLQELKRPTQIAESFYLLNVIRKLVKAAHQSPGNFFERFRGSLELIARFEFDFRRRGNFFSNDSNFWCVQSSTTSNQTVHVHVLWRVCTHTIQIRMLWCL